jgi:hypothetical protein
MKRVLLVVLWTAAAACAADDGDSVLHRDEAADASRPAAPSAGPEIPTSAAQSGERDLGVLHAAFVTHADSIDRRLRQVRALTREERARLQRDVNEIQIERARQLGVRVVTVEPLAEAGRLVRLPDTTQHWILRDLDYSVPYVTPDAHEMLIEIGERFHARLDSAGVPRYRIDITSVLRTPEKQAELRRRNSNASRVESAHEFGTTVDLAYRRFAPPAGPLPLEPHPSLAQAARLLCDSIVVETGRLRGAELQAVLGRVLREMQEEGKVLVRMERRQTVYHITVARRFPQRESVATR